MKLGHPVLFGFGRAHSSGAIAEIIRRFAELKALVPNITTSNGAKTQAQKASITDTAMPFCSFSPILRRGTPILCIPITPRLRTGYSHLCLR